MARDSTVSPMVALHRELVELTPQLRRYAYALTRNPADADDLVQATLERVLSRTMPEGADVSKWSYTVCRNVWIDEIRARKVRRDAVPEVTAQAEGVLSAEDMAAARLQLKHAQAGIDLLPDEQREVLALVAIAGMAYREAAEALAVPIGTVMSRLARARAALAAHMEAVT